MKLILQNTDKIVEVNGIPCRVWEGKTESGIECHAMIALVGVHRDLDSSQFEAELQEKRPLSAELNRAIPMRMIL